MKGSNTHCPQDPAKTVSEKEWGPLDPSSCGNRRREGSRTTGGKLNTERVGSFCTRKEGQRKETELFLGQEIVFTFQTMQQLQRVNILQITQQRFSWLGEYWATSQKLTDT